MGFISNIFARGETVEHEIVTDVEDVIVPVIQSVDRFIEPEVKRIFDAMHSAAMAANTEVNDLKNKLADALAKARDLHKTAADAAVAAQAAAEAEVAKYKSAVSAHFADMNTQGGQIIVQAPPAKPAGNAVANSAVVVNTVSS